MSLLPPTSSSSLLGRLPGSLRTRLFLLLVAFSLGPLLVTNSWGYFQTRGQFTDAAFRNARNVSALEASQTLEFVHSRRELVASMAAGNRYLNDLVRAMATNPDPDQRADYIERLHDHLVAKAGKTTSTEELLVLDQDARVLATSSERPVDTATIKTCLWAQEQNTIVNGPEVEPGTGEVDEPTFVDAVTLRVDEKPIGTLCGRFRFDVHKELMRAHKERTTDADLYLVDAAGHRLCGSFPDTETTYGRLVHPAALAVVKAGVPWVGRYESPQSGKVIAAYTPMAQLGWGILVEIPERKALAPLERLKRQAFGMGVLFFALMVPAMFATARATARPLHTLADAARRVASGGPGDRVPESGATEMQQLARSFNHMSAGLKEAHDHLEQRITERTAELRRSQEFTELLLDSIEQRVLVIDHDLHIVKANRAAQRLHGRDLVGLRCCDVLVSQTEECEQCPVRSIFDTGRPTRSEVTERTVRGKDILQLDTFPVRSATGDVEAVVQIGRVVTGEKQLLVQTMHQEKMAALGLLAAGLAHEIGNPLASIQSQLAVVREMPDSERARETIPVVERQVTRISGLLRELTDFARRKRDEVVLVSVNQVVEDVARLVGHDPRSRSVAVELRPAADLPGVRAKEDHLVQVLLNLGLNAIDAMPEGGTLRLETSLEGHAVVVRVRDTGTGIPDAVRARLFEPFLSTKEAGRGTGLGLFVSKGIIEALGGTLRLERTGPDGTVFAVHLPLDGRR